MNYILLMGVRMENKRHKHADLIHAWAEGAIIQYSIGCGIWNNCPDNKPMWEADDRIYRVRPTKRVIKFRNWLMRSGDIVVWQLGQGTSCPDTTPNFAAWVGDWQRIEVEADDNNSGGFEFNAPFDGIRVE